MKIYIPKYNPDNEFERRLTNPHKWVVVHDGGPEQCTQCGCWDPTPVGMQAYSMAPKECDAAEWSKDHEPENLTGRELDEIMTLDEEIKHLFEDK